MSRKHQWAFCLTIGMAASGCAGNGNGLDVNGRPINGGESAPLAANLQSIQDHVFTPICTQCHAGAAAPLGFRLDQDSAYAMLVNAPSSEAPGLQRVTPGDPDASYLIQKLEGRAAVGAQMPLGQPPLPQATINVIRQWIANGAQATASATQPAVMPMQVRAIEPTFLEPLDAQHPQILLQADGEISVASLNDRSVQVINSAGDVFSTHVDVRSLDPTVLAISGVFPPGDYRLVIRAAKDREGLPVGDFTHPFSVEDVR